MSWLNHIPIQVVEEIEKELWENPNLPYENERIMIMNSLQRLLQRKEFRILYKTYKYIKR